MAIAELFIGAVITVLVEKLASADFIRLARSAGISSEVGKLKNTLPLIQAVLADAAQKHVSDTSVQLWLNQLQHLAYEIDDVLDDLATEAIRRLMNQEHHSSTSSSTSKVLKYIPTKFHALKYSRKMSSKLDGITATLRDLIEKISILGLTNKVEIPNRAAFSKQLVQTSLLPIKDVIGRESDKEALLEKLLGSEASSSQNVSVMSIVGMGGIGKTTLAQLLYNDEKVKDHFELMSWVSVSENFDGLTVIKTIFQDVGGYDNKITTLNQFQVALREKLSNKRFLIVLDDVWNENGLELENFQRPFTVGAHGSKILLTTRKVNVASAMKSAQDYSLELLSHKEALSLFAQHASDEQNSNMNQKLELYGDDIVKKCGRLPLALKILGSAFYGKSSDEEWEKILNNEIWKFDKENQILPALKLGYYDLPPHLKQMIAYCCLFPKDYVFDKDELVLLWMAEGFLSKPNQNESMEIFGQECFKELVLRSFFQHSNSDKSRYTMHDLINDLARSVAGEFFHIIYDKNETLEKSHHVSFICTEYNVYKKFKAVQTTRSLRTFLAISVTWLPTWKKLQLSNKVLIELLPRQKLLRVLSLINCAIEEVPNSIGSLKHLRYLNVSYTVIRCLPEEVSNLHNLESLLLSGCHKLSCLPNSIVKLINLRHLDISDTPFLNKMPLGIGRLTSLRTLSKSVIGEAHESKIYDLKGMLHLQGQLCIKGLQKVKNASHAREANLQQKKGICDLQMEWCDVFDDSRNEISEYEVLEGLRAFEKLKSLKIIYYSGTKFPCWVGDPSFVCLTELTLRKCTSCTCLPTLGHLPSLQKLFVEGMYGLKSLGLEFLGPSNSFHGDAFPSLEVLKFEDMKGWQEWSTIGCDKSRVFPCLREISIIKCPKLDVVAMELIPSLRVLHVEECILAVLSSMAGASSSIAELKIQNIEGLTQLHGDVLQRLKLVEYLNISGCGDLTYLWESGVKEYDILDGLQKLEVSECENLVSLGEKEMHLKSVTEVKIKYCVSLKSYNCPNNIEKLVMMACPFVTSLSFPTMDDHSSSLKILTIWSCENMEVCWLVNKFLSSLESLYIYDMPSIRSFPEGGLVHLTTLTISSCDGIESIPDNGYGFLPLLCLRYLRIYNCKNLNSFPHEQLQNLISLEKMEMTNCPSLDDSFPCGLWPPNLSSLTIGELKKPISEWGLQNFPNSLVTLELHGRNSDGVVSFGTKAEEDMSCSSSCFLLPSSLINLDIQNFRHLESIKEGLQHLTCLQHLEITECRKLRDLPETLLPSLSSLHLSDCCPELFKKCSPGRKGKYWPIISQIPEFKLYPVYETESSETESE